MMVPSISKLLGYAFLIHSMSLFYISLVQDALKEYRNFMFPFCINLCTLSYDWLQNINNINMH